MAQLGQFSTAYNLKVTQSGSGSISTIYGSNLKLTKSSDGSFRAPGDIVTLKNSLGGGGGTSSVAYLADLIDVTEVVKEDGVMLQWTANSSQYEVDFVCLDAGEF